MPEILNSEAKEITDPGTIKIQPLHFARGGNADVFQADWLPPSADQPLRVAVKVLHLRGVGSLDDDDEQWDRITKRLKREMRVWGKLNHPHVVPLVGYIFAGNSIIPSGNPCLISPFYAFGDLNAYLRRHPDADSLALLLQAAEGINYLHTLPNPIMHLDVKAQNILINDQEHAQICDFGLSRILDDGPTGFTTDGGLGFTASHASPEVLNGDGVTSAADVFSFANLILQTLSGKQPYYKLGRTYSKVILAIVRGEAPVIGDHPIAMHTAPLKKLWVLLRDCWRSDPAYRPTMAGLMRQLRVVQNLHGVFRTDRFHPAARAPPTDTAELDSWETLEEVAEEIQDDHSFTIEAHPFADGYLADIYRGSWLPPGKGQKIPVAVKVMSFLTMSLDTSPERPIQMDKRLEREMRVWARLNHPRIVPLLGYMRSKNKLLPGGAPCLVSPLFRLGTLKAYLGNHPSINRIPLLQQVAEGLYYLHTLKPPVIHGNLRSRRILINDQGEAMIGGFSVSRLADDCLVDQSFSPDYWLSSGSPEMLLGDETTSADVYSFGNLVLTVLSGKRPHYERPIGRMIQAILKGVIPVRSDHTIPMPPMALDKVWALMTRCWALDPSKRPLMAEVIRELRVIEDLEASEYGTQFDPAHPLNSAQDTTL